MIKPLAGMPNGFWNRDAAKTSGEPHAQGRQAFLRRGKEM